MGTPQSAVTCINRVIRFEIACIAEKVRRYSVFKGSGERFVLLDSQVEHTRPLRRQQTLFTGFCFRPIIGRSHRLPLRARIVCPTFVWFALSEEHRRGRVGEFSSFHIPGSKCTPYTVGQHYVVCT